MIDLLSGAGIFANSAIIATVAILIAGIAFGLGVAVRSKRLRDFGKEELFQVIITLAIIGVVMAVVQAIDSTVDMAYNNVNISYSCNTTNITGHTSKVLNTSLCLCENNLDYINTLSYDMMRSQYILGYLSKIGVHLGVISAEPFTGLGEFVHYIGSHLTLAFITSSLLWFEDVTLRLIAYLAMPIFFPLGLLLRLFFPTRRLGAVLIAIGVSFYIVFPVILLVTAPTYSLSDHPFESFNQRYSFVPMTDLNRESELLNVTINISMTNTTQDIVSQATYEINKAGHIINIILYYNLISIVLALATSVVFAWETYKLLGSPMIATWYYV